MKTKKEFENCNHHESWYTANGKGKILYCLDCDSLFTITTCEHCNGNGGFFVKIKRKENGRKKRSETNKSGL